MHFSCSFSRKPYPHCLVLVGSRKGSKHDLHMQNVLVHNGFFTFRNVMYRSMVEVSLTTRVYHTARLTTTRREVPFVQAARNPLLDDVSRPCTKSFIPNISSVRSVWNNWIKGHLRNKKIDHIVIRVLLSCLVE